MTKEHLFGIGYLAYLRDFALRADRRPREAQFAFGPYEARFSIEDQGKPLSACRMVFEIDLGGRLIRIERTTADRVHHYSWNGELSSSEEIAISLITG